MSALGERFRAAREARGLTLSDVSEQIRIRSIYLGAIEDEHWSAIGAPVYVRGFLRTYARFLGLDPEEAVAEFGRTLPAEPTAEEAPSAANEYRYQSPGPSRPMSAMIWVAALIAVVLIALVTYNTYSEIALHRGGETVATAASPSSSPSAGASELPSASPSSNSSSSPGPSPTTSASPLGTGALVLHFVQASWVRVSVDGNVSMEGTFPAGTERAFNGKTALLRVGNAGGVQVFVNGKSVGPLGKVGDVVERAIPI